MPMFGGPTPRKDFMKATRLTSRHFDRYECEGWIRTHYDRDRHDFIVENAAEFVEQRMRPQISNWPPPLASLDAGLEQEFAQSGGRPDIAARIIEPFRFEALADRWADIVELARPAVRLVPGGVDRLGGTRLGGTPDAPRTFAWPYFFDDAPLAFIAQVDLRDVQAVYPNDLVPQAGLLSFFYDAKQEAWGFDRKDGGRWAVFLFEPPFAPVGMPAAVPEEGQYKPVQLQARGELTLPAHDSLEIERLGLTAQQGDAYRALSIELDELTGNDVHRFLGWPEEIQHDPAVEVQLPANGIYAGDATGYESDEGKRLMEQRDVWQLLLQVDSEEDAGMQWGDVGRLYFMIRRSDLANRDWSEVWFSLQCT